jgi:hypothetical protein
MKEVKLKSSFEEILGVDNTQFTEEQRRQRWNEWKALAVQKGNKDLVESWSETEACQGCIHLNENESWCESMGLPCTVNPVLSFRMAMPGMACAGANKQSL